MKTNPNTINLMSTDRKRIVVKVGSNVLTHSDGTPNVTNMSALVDQIAEIHSAGHQVVVVSSGAVACGRGAIEPSRQLDPVESRQLFSAIGQIRLMNIYSNLFGLHNIVIGQVLTQKENFSSRTSYLNQRGCMLTMLENGVVPVVNENDTASLTELMFTDNDELSGLIATMIDATMLVILSNVDGIYTGDPADSSSQLIARVSADDNLSDYVSETKSGFGRGGMGTKCNTARKVASEGVMVVIAKGDRRNVLTDLINCPDSVPHTLFVPSSEPLSKVKRWIAHSGSFAKGSICVNDQAAEMLRSEKALSLLPVGVVSTDGSWEAGDIVAVVDSKGQRIAVGKAAVDSAQTVQTMGCHVQRPIIHYDYLYLE